MKRSIISILQMGVLIMSLFNCNAADEETVRRTAVAGPHSFYPSDPVEVKKKIEKYLSAGKSLAESPKIIVSPHAGYRFSGPVAGIGFATIDKNAKRVILIGPSHRKYFNGISIPDVDAYETPLGNIPLDKKTIAKLRSNAMVHAHADAHSQEHCLEVQLPFLKIVLSDFKIIPIIVGDIKNHKEVSDLLFPLIDDKTLVVISSDFSHYQSHEEAKRTDARSIETIMKSNLEGFLDACGENPLRIAMHLAGKMNLEPKLLDVRNSFETAKLDHSQVVGYASIVYLSKTNGSSDEKANKQVSSDLSKEEKDFMLKLARDALNKAVRGEKPPSPKDIPAAAQTISGCFVTLTKKGNLRGCIGYIEGIKPLYQAIIDNAKNSALGDPRFPNVSPDELKSLKVEVSVLTKPVSIDYTDIEDLLSKIEVGIDGIILRKGHRQSTYLPQVWDQLPDKVEFLEHLAMKAGLDRNDWKDAEYKKYQAIHFEEE